MSPLSSLPFQPPSPWPRSQRPCVKRLVTCAKGNCLLCAGGPTSGPLFTSYLVLPPLRYPWKTRPESDLPVLRRARGAGAGRGGTAGRWVSACSLHARTETPKSARARSQRPQRSEEKARAARKRCQARCWSQGRGGEMPHGGLNLRACFKSWEEAVLSAEPCPASPCLWQGAAQGSAGLLGKRE